MSNSLGTLHLPITVEEAEKDASCPYSEIIDICHRSVIN
ncbi:hypothetical protein DSBG_4386 [Desulfosporosinus sp. BG]|nr:hypothetical protein DSBG_4386 [Desulfosporosinus sp. BG]